MLVDILSVIVLFAVLYLIAYWFDKPWKFFGLSMKRRKELAKDRIEIIEGGRINYPEWYVARGKFLLNLENKELEKLYEFVQEDSVNASDA